MDIAGSRVQNPHLGILLLCGGVAMFGMGEACVKVLSKDFEILQVVWARYTFHALVFLLIFSRSGIRSQMATKRPFLHLARSAALLGGTVCFFTALIYLSLIKEELGNRWLQPDLFRFGASSLLGDIERQLEHHVTGAYSAAYRHPMG